MEEKLSLLFRGLVLKIPATKLEHSPDLALKY